MRVLLIEDDASVAASLELMLKSESFNTYTTDLGEEGIDLGKLYDYDCPTSAPVGQIEGLHERRMAGPS